MPLNKQVNVISVVKPAETYIHKLWSDALMSSWGLDKSSDRKEHMLRENVCEKISLLSVLLDGDNVLGCKGKKERKKERKKEIWFGLFL